MDLIYFVLFVSILIFIHESGHFTFAKIFGVKVLTFSIGFGPTLLRLRGRETTYCVALLPFGGFVQMLEANKSKDPILPEDKTRTFEAQALWKRMVIVLAGPAMNLLFPILLYTSVYAGEKEALGPVVGAVIPGKPAEGKLLPKDVIVAIDGESVSTFRDVKRAFANHANVPLHVIVEREGHQITVDVTAVEETIAVGPAELELLDHVGQIGIIPRFYAPVVGVSAPNSPAYRAGLRTFDRITAVNGRTVLRFVDLIDELAKNKGDTVVVSFMRPTSAASPLVDLNVMEPGVATLTPLPHEAAHRTPDPHDTIDEREADVRERTGIEGTEMYAATVPEGSGEWRAGLRPGDRIVSLDGIELKQWKALEGGLLSDPRKAHTLAWQRLDSPMSGVFQLRKESWRDEYSQQYEKYVFRTNHLRPFAKDKLVEIPHPLWNAIQRGFEETRSAIRLVSAGFARLLQGRMSLSAMSGPITLYEVAGEAGARGGTTFAWAMAMTSVNLGLINLVPIPVLDGGHLLFFVVEWIRRRPISLKAREVSSLIGMGLLVVLMAIAFKNDVSRKWGPGIRSQHHENM